MFDHMAVARKQRRKNAANLFGSQAASQVNQRMVDEGVRRIMESPHEDQRHMD